ncbi:MAG: hypothetical protein RRC07_13850 [Anaerolineae bacterium]|nr:hypothetical protein [Anaerolineae bacterium]
MNSKIRLVYLLVVLALALGLAAGASAAAARIVVTGKEIPLCYSDPPHPDCTYGEWSFPDGNQHVRNMVQVYQVICSDPRVVGVNTLVANANWDADGLGPGWGTFHHQPATISDGYWEGTFSAMMTADGYVSRIVGQGYGALEGLFYTATEVNGEFEGVILELPTR